MGKRLQKMVDGIAALPPEERQAAIKDKFEKKEWNHADVKWQLQSNKRQYEEKSQGR